MMEAMRGAAHGQAVVEYAISKGADVDIVNNVSYSTTFPILILSLIRDVVGLSHDMHE